MSNTDLWAQARAKLDSAITQLNGATGQITAAIASLNAASGQAASAVGLIQAAEALGDQITDSAAVEYDFRGIYVRDSEFAACLAKMGTMGLNGMECQIFSGTTNLLTRMNQLVAPQVGWSMLGHFTPSTAGGTHTLNDASVITIVDGIKNHPQNSHRYYIADEPDISGYTTAQQDLNRNSLRARRNLIKSRDPLAIVSFAEYLQAQLEPTQARPYGMWGGTDPVGATTYTSRVIDEVWLSGYPNWTGTGYQENLIPDTSGWCDAAGIPYVWVVSAHDYLTNKPAYPTQTTFTHMMDQIKATNSQGIVVYIWYDAEGTTHLSNNPAAPLANQASVGAEMAKVTP